MTDDDKALVERLEEWEWTLRAVYKAGDLGTDEPAIVMGEASDRIEALSAENERLKRSAEYWEQDAKRYAANQEYWRMEERAAIVALAAEYMGDIEFAQFKHALNADDQFLDPNHYWYRQGKDDGIEQERGNIVEWLMRIS